MAYAEFDGLDAHRDAWTKTAAYKLLNETTTGAMYEQMLGAARRSWSRRARRDCQSRGKNWSPLGLHLIRSGFAVGINRAGGEGPPRCLCVVIRGGARGEARATLERLLKAGGPPERQSARQSPNPAAGRSMSYGRPV